MAQNSQYGQASVPAGSGGFRITPKMILLGLITAAAIRFILANRDDANIRMWVTDVQAPMWLVLATLLVGWLAGWLIRRRRQ